MIRKKNGTLRSYRKINHSQSYFFLNPKRFSGMIVCRKNTSILALWNFTPLVSTFTICQLRASTVHCSRGVKQVHTTKRKGKSEKNNSILFRVFLILPYEKRKGENKIRFLFDINFFTTLPLLLVVSTLLLLPR